jgi:hypothetical protein
MLDAILRVTEKDSSEILEKMPWLYSVAVHTVIEPEQQHG